jgi:CHAT domain-containing protein
MRFINILSLLFCVFFQNNAFAEVVFNSESAASFYNEGAEYNNEGDYKKALISFKKAFNILSQEFPNSDAFLLTTKQLANAYSLTGDYENARKHFEELVMLRKKSNGISSPQYAVAFVDLGNLLAITGDYFNAIEKYKIAIKILESESCMKLRALPMTYDFLGGAYYAMGDSGKALFYTEKALKLCLQYNHKEELPVLYESISMIESYLGNYKNALNYLQKALPLYIQKYGSETHPEVALVRLKIGSILVEEKRLDEATHIMQDTFDVISNYKNGPQFDQAIACMIKLYKAKKDPDACLKYTEKLLSRMQTANGPESKFLVGCLLEISNIYLYKNDSKNALIYANKALKCSNKSNNIINLTDYLLSLAEVFYVLNENDKARECAMKYINSINEDIDKISLMDDQSRILWAASHKKMSCLPLIIDPELLAKFIINFKGAILDSIIKDQSNFNAISKNEKLSQKYFKLLFLKKNLSKCYLSNDSTEDRTKLTNEIAALQRELLSNVNVEIIKPDNIQNDITCISEILTDRSVFIDIFEFEDPKLSEKNRSQYGVIIIAKNRSPIFISIAERSSIDVLIDSLLYNIGDGNQTALQENIANLSAKLWAPISDKISSSINQIIISPDGKLNFLSFAALLDGNGRFVAEKYQLSYVGSARDLVRTTSARQDKTLALFANPLFDASQPAANTKDMLAMRSIEADVYGMVSLPALPATEKEAGMLGGLASDSGWNAKISLGSRATEQAVRGVKRPGILHLATHGFYLASYSPPGPNDSRGMSIVGIQETAEEKNKKGVDPMRASGVALTGAQQTLKSWSQMKAPDPENDGILTAEEVGALDLTGTWLVTLSACETGVGEARSGEGVFGLRRAFMIAGAENLLMTLWPVNDASTADFMADFYREALASGDAPGALAEVQREWLVRLRNQKGLLAAVRDAGPFVMATTGRPNRFNQFSKKPDFGFIK